VQYPCSFTCVGMMDPMRPEHVAPLILWLCHEDCDVSGQLFECGGGWMTRCKPASFFVVYSTYTILVTTWISYPCELISTSIFSEHSARLQIGHTFNHLLA